MSGEAIEIEYQLTVDDYAKFSADVQTSPARLKASRKVLFWICVYFAALIEFMCWVTYLDKVKKGEISGIDFLSYHYPYWFSSVNAFILFVLFFLYWRCFTKKRVYRRLIECTKKLYSYGENKAFLSKKRIKISSKSIISSCKYGNFEYFWPGIEGVQIINSDLALYSSAVSALVIPSRFFKSEEEKQRIYEQCVKWWEAAQEKPVTQEAAA